MSMIFLKYQEVFLLLKRNLKLRNKNSRIIARLSTRFRDHVDEIFAFVVRRVSTLHQC